MEKELSTNLTEKDFNLSKVKLLPGGGIQVEYQVTCIMGDEPSVIERNETHTRDAHPDLLKLFEGLRGIVAVVFNITSFLAFLKSDEMKLSEPEKELAKKYAEELISMIDVRGVEWSNDRRSIVITATIEAPNGQKACVKTPRIGLVTLSFGFEGKLDYIVESIKSEVYAYLFKGKQAQLSLFGEGSGEIGEIGEIGDLPDGKEE